jgi:hypothetical protein
MPTCPCPRVHAHVSKPTFTCPSQWRCTRPCAVYVWVDPQCGRKCRCMCVCMQVCELGQCQCLCQCSLPVLVYCYFLTTAQPLNLEFCRLDFVADIGIDSQLDLESATTLQIRVEFPCVYDTHFSSSEETSILAVHCEHIGCSL